jgi:RNA polymerase sigma factor (sigma-70 family)
VNAQTDQQLLQAYVTNRSEAAFAELVRRHIDLVYSAALRRIADPHLAQDVTQGTFAALAQNARQVTSHPVLSGWLHRTTQNIATNLIRTSTRRHAREQEAVTMNQLLSTPSGDASWHDIAPQLDAALDELDSPDRDAVLLRYFEKKSAREMAAQLGISDDAAQKRVSRAVERLREFFSKRGVTVGASGLAVIISANAVQAAPVGLALTISTAAALTGRTLATTATVTGIKTIAMTTLQKTLIAATLIAVFTTPLVMKHREVARLRKEVVALQWEKESLLARQPIEGAATAQDAASAAVPKVEVSEPADPLPAEVVAKIAALLAERKPMDKSRMETWAKLVAQIPPDQIGQALQAALQLPDHEIRTAITQSLFRNWVETNPRAALAFATVNFQGREKSDAIRDALQRWAVQDPDVAFAAWREQLADSTKRLSWGGDRQETVEALFAGMAQQDFQKAVENMKGLDGDLFSSALKGLGVTAAKTEQGREFFLDQLKQLSDQPVSYEAMTSFMSSWAQSDLTSARTWVDNQPAGKQHDYALRQVGLTYVQRDPKAGADWWLGQAAQVEEERSRAYFDIGQTWAGSDIKAAGEWLNQQPKDNALNSGLSGFADVAVEHDPVVALQWAASITEPSHRNSVLAKTWQKWQRSDSAAAEQFLTQSGWPIELVAKAHGNAH